MAQERKFKCYDCNHEWGVPSGTGVSGREMTCPKCGSSNIHRAPAGKMGQGRGRGGSGRGPRGQA
jgi:transcription elongation factor Elf1